MVKWFFCGSSFAKKLLGENDGLIISRCEKREKTKKSKNFSFAFGIFCIRMSMRFIQSTLI